MFSGAAISAVDTGQAIKALTFTVSGVDGTSAEKIKVDGAEISLAQAGTNGTTSNSSIGYSVSVSGSMATVNLTSANGLSASAAQTLVNAISYQYATINGMRGDHTVTLTGITDSGVNNNTSTLNVAQTLHDATAPTLGAPAPSYALTSNNDGNGSGNSVGESIVLTVRFDGAVNGLTSGSTTNAIFNVGGTGVTATWGGSDGDSTRTLTYTIAAGQNGQATINEATLKSVLMAAITDSSGNAFALSGDIANIDTPALPLISTTPTLLAGDLGMVTNLDVASNLVFTSQVALNLGTTGRIRILDQNTSGAGFRSDTNDNDQTIDLANAFDRGLITLSDGGKTITINPKWDLDLSSNYRIEVDKGAFVSQADNTDAQALAVDFSTVTPGNFNSNTIKTIQALSTSSSKMNDTGGMDADNRWWFDVERIGDIITKMTQLGDLSDKSYVLVAKNYATEPGGPKNPNDIYEDGLNGIEIQETHVGFTNFGANDQIYFDGQANNTAVQKFDSLYAEIYSNQIADGHLNNQNIFSFGTTFLQDGTLNDTGQAFIGLSLVGQTTYQKVDLLYAIPEFADLIGLDKVLGSAHPVIMA